MNWTVRVVLMDSLWFSLLDSHGDIFEGRAPEEVRAERLGMLYVSNIWGHISRADLKTEPSVHTLSVKLSLALSLS